MSDEFFNVQRKYSRWSIFPYVQWTLESGSIVTADRKYRPICEELLDGSVVIMDPTTWVAFTDQRFLWLPCEHPANDPECRNRVLEIVERLGLADELKCRRDLERAGKLPAGASRPKKQGRA